MRDTYIIQFEKPIDMLVDGHYGDRLHYVGYSTKLIRRMRQHFKGEGALPTIRAWQLGIKMKIISFIAGNVEKEIINGAFWRTYCRCDVCRDIQKQTTIHNLPCNPEAYRLAKQRRVETQVIFKAKMAQQDKFL